MLWIGEEFPVADCLPEETLQAWKARGAPTKPAMYYIWAPAGPGEADPIFGPFNSQDEARQFATTKGYSRTDVLDEYPCSCMIHGETNESD